MAYPGGSLLKTAIISLIFGIIIELLQGAFTTTRQADIKDVAANFTGTLIACTVLILFRKRLQ